jgi:hypothetical protein
MNQSDLMNIDASRASIEKLQAVADRFFETVTQPTLKEQARIAQRDLKDALVWLTRMKLEARPCILHIVTVNVELASERLRMVEHALKTYGEGRKTKPV